MLVQLSNKQAFHRTVDLKVELLESLALVEAIQAIEWEGVQAFNISPGVGGGYPRG